MEPTLPGHEMLNALATIATSVGLSSALILFFVWWAFKREERMQQRMETLEDFTRTQLVSLVKETSVALTRDAEATVSVQRAIEASTNVIKESVDTAREVKSLLMEHHKFAESIAQDLKHKT